MHNTPVPPPSELPSSRTLLRSTLVALAVAVGLLVTVVLPAEYAVDPTGIGRALGLQRMGEIKMALAREAAAADSAEALLGAQGTVADSAVAPAAEDSTHVPTGSGSARRDSIIVTLTPGQGTEVKLAMDEGASVEYRWTVEGGVVNHDTHGDPVNAPAGFYHGYGRGTAMPSDSGTLVAAFTGTHGWFWRNRGAATVTVTLLVTGAFLEVIR